MPPASVPTRRPEPPPRAAPTGMESPKVNSAGPRPRAAPRAPPAARPVAPPLAPRATAPLAADAAETWTCLSAAALRAAVAAPEATALAQLAALLARSRASLRAAVLVSWALARAPRAPALASDASADRYALAPLAQMSAYTQANWLRRDSARPRA